MSSSLGRVADLNTQPQQRGSRAAALCGVMLAILVGCGGDAPGPAPRNPVITVSGIADGETRTGPVTITISIDVGTFEATLNGEAFISGRTVSDPGAYVLLVTARNGDATSSLELAFTIALVGETRLIVRMFDLGANESGGGGDAILLTDSSSAGQRHVLVDAGPAGVGGSDPGFVARGLAALGVDTLEALVLSHAHGDHFGGMATVLSQVVVRRFVYNGQVRNLAAYNAVIGLAQSRADTVIVPASVTAVTLGFGATPTALAVLPPLGDFLTNPDATSSEINDGSLGTEVTKGSFRMLLAGDGEVLANLRWRTAFGSRTGNVTVLKVGHHGANDAVFDNGFSGSSAWVQHTAHEVAVLSANGTTHPRRNATALLLGLPSTATYCTNVHGTIEIRVGEAGDFQVTVERNQGVDCAPGTDADT